MKLFEDMFSSHRGAGVIGTVVAVGVLLSLGVLFLLVFDEDLQGADKSIEFIIAEQAIDIENLNSSIASQLKSIESARKNIKIAEDVESSLRQFKLREARVGDAVSQIAKINTDIDEIKKNHDQYIIAYRKNIRANTIGAKYPELITQSGRKYQNVIIKKIDDLRVSVQHDGGSGSINWNELPTEMIDRLQFTKELADAQINAEHKSAQHFSDAADSSSVKESIASIEVKIKEAEEAFRVKREAVSLSQGGIDRALTEIKRLQMMITAEEDKQGLKQTPRYRAQIQIQEKVIQTEQNRMKEFSSLEAKHLETIADLEKQKQACRDKLEKIGK